MAKTLEWQDQVLRLERLPVSRDPNLQAWDAADEYLLNEYRAHCSEESSSHEPLLILNDSFGALCCALAQHPREMVSDSYLSHRATERNHRSNDLSISELILTRSTDRWQLQPTRVLMKLPKSAAFLEQQLYQLQQHLQDGTEVWCGARARDIQRSHIELFEKYLGPTSCSLAWKKSRIIRTTRVQRRTTAPDLISRWKLEGTRFELLNLANVFARNRLDIGARVMLDNLPRARDYQHAIDLGCGNGVLGLQLMADNRVKQLSFVDESYMAVASARQTIKHNLPDYQHCCEFIANHCLQDLPLNNVDLVLCNPPSHQQNTLMDDIAWQMFLDARSVLQPGGELRIVGNRHLGYHVKLKRLFGNCRLIAGNRKFSVLSARKS
jgi:16S rRNA G1207 methylase RsmC